MKVHITITDDDGNTYKGLADLAAVTGKRKIGTISGITAKKPKKTPLRPIDAVNQLYKEEFFKVERTLTVVRKELNARGFNFSKSSIYNALDLAEFLIKKGSKGNYAFIQKYPPS